MRFWLILLLIYSAPSFGYRDIYLPVVEKHIKKVQDRWTLEDLYIKRRMPKKKKRWSSWSRKFMFEFLVDFRFGSANRQREGLVQEGDDTRMIAASLQYFYGPFGLGLERDQQKVKEKAMFFQRDEFTFSYRLIGPSTQSTHLTALMGYRTGRHNDYETFRQNYYGLLANFYLFRHFGLEARYRLSSATTTSTYDLSHYDYHWGIFWELNILRVYVNFFQDYFDGTRLSDRANLKQRISGNTFGMRLNF
jgi:hypothetical protein